MQLLAGSVAHMSDDESIPDSLSSEPDDPIAAHVPPDVDLGAVGTGLSLQPGGKLTLMFFF